MKILKQLSFWLVILVILAVRPEQFGPELTAEGLTVEGLVQNQILDALRLPE